MSYMSLADALLRGHGVERQFMCPSHHDTNASASVNIVKGLWVCYGCNARGKVDEGSIQIQPKIVTQQISAMRKKIEDSNRRAYPESWLNIFTAAGPGEYWLSRFTEAACSHFLLGVTVDGTSAVFPLRDGRGDVIGVIERSLTGAGPKYKYPFGVDISHYLFNFHSCESDVIILTEGATDSIAAWEVGREAMAIYGAGLRPPQVKLLQKYGPKKIILAFDQDSAGHRAAQQARSTLSQALPLAKVVRASWDGYKDLASIPLGVRASSVAWEGKV